MRFYLISFLFLISLNVQSIFDFQVNSDISNWYVVVDGVMGGKSTGNFQLNEDGHAVFTGTISLENNGGFSSVRYDMEKMEISDDKTVSIRLKGDGKNYQFRVKNNDQDYFSYIAEFTTNGEWQEVEINLKDMYPSFRGRKLNKPNFNHSHIDEVTFLIANKKNEEFQLLIDKIELK